MCIDLKSFYASVECVERSLDPLTTNLVVCDESRTSKTICLAVSPSLKSYDISGRARLFEVISRVNEINKERSKKCKLTFSSYDNNEVINNNNAKLDFIRATPRMSLYIKYSRKIFDVYLKYFSENDMFSYSIDEVFFDITNYLNYYKLSPKSLATKILKDVYEETHITATCGIGTNLYLAKVAMDIVAKHMKPDENGVRISELDEMSYRRVLWNHTPITDFWRIGPGYKNKLLEHKLYTMGDIALCSVNNEDLLYKLFGINAELLIDHAWGYEIVTIKDIKSYKPQSSSLSSSQVLYSPYDYKKALLIVKEMTELLVLDLVEKKLITDKLTLTIGYDVENLTKPNIRNNYHGKIVMDHYGRFIPAHSHGTINLERKTASTTIIMKNMVELYNKIVNEHLLIRRIGICACNLTNDILSNKQKIYKQFDLFSDSNIYEVEKNREKENEIVEKKLQLALIDIKKKYGKNSVLKAMNLESGATTIQRNLQIGGHKG